MKKVLVFLICFILCTSFCFADTENKVATSSALFYDYPTDILELLAARQPLASGVIEGELVNVEKSLMRVSANDATGFKAVMLGLLGDYETVITDYTYQSSGTGYYSHSISIERDWSWICSAAIFGLVIFCVFRVIGVLLKR